MTTARDPSVVKLPQDDMERKWEFLCLTLYKVHCSIALPDLIMETKKGEIISYIDTIALLLLVVMFFLFPLVIFSGSTDPFVLPKYVLMGVGTLVLLLLFAGRFISEGGLRVSRTPFDLPLSLFAVSLILSTAFSIQLYQSLMTVVPLLLSIILYFLITNFVKNRSSVMLLIYAYILGASVIAALAVCSYLKIYILPFSFAHAQSFTLMGSLLDQAIYAGVALSDSRIVTGKLPPGACLYPGPEAVRR